MEWTKEKIENRFKEILADIKKEGIHTKGKAELINYCEGKKLSPSQSIKAHCYQCMGYQNNPGENKDCENPVCPLYPYMSYSSLKPKTNRPPMSIENREKARVRLSKLRRKK